MPTTETIPTIKNVFIDGDILAYVCSSAVQKDIDWGDGLWTCHAYLNEALDYFTQCETEIFNSIRLKCDFYDDVNILYCFSDRNNFRKLIYPDYKANRRSNRKPTCYYDLVAEIKKIRKSMTLKNLEGDDVISINVTATQEPSLIVSKDKDFKTVPMAYFYDINKDSIVYYDTETAYRNLLIQTLTGDTADNYKGCPKVGKVSAERIINSEPSVLKLWELTEITFLSKGATENDALRNFSLAYLLQDRDYDLKKKEWKHPEKNYYANPSYADWAYEREFKHLFAKDSLNDK